MELTAAEHRLGHLHLLARLHDKSIPGDDLLDAYRDNLSESTAGPALGSMAGSFAEPADDGAVVGTTAKDANIIEYGTSSRSARSPLRRAAERFGRFRPN